MQEENPYGAPRAPLEVAISGAAVQLGSRWRRLGAVFIDMLICGPFVWGLAFATGAAQGIWQAILAHKGTYGQVWTLQWTLVGFALYCVIQAYPLSTHGQSWGKRVLRLKIVDLQGRKPPLAKLLFVRYAFRIGAALIPLVGGLCVLIDDLFIFRDDRRCIHDHIAGTRVVVAD